MTFANFDGLQAVCGVKMCHEWRPAFDSCGKTASPRFHPQLQESCALIAGRILVPGWIPVCSVSP